MPRTINREVHQERRDAFLDVAQHLIQTKGYEQMSINDVLEQLETSRGAFYHYFDSKADLLEAVVDRFASAAMATVTPILEDPSLPALKRLERVIGGIAQFKAGQKELVLAIMDAWFSDGNALFREKIRRMTAALLEPILTRVIQQGIEEGVINATSPEATARVIVFIIQGYQELAGKQFLARQAGTISFEDVVRANDANTEALERILGAPPGSVHLVDVQTLRAWYG